MKIAAVLGLLLLVLATGSVAAQDATDSMNIGLTVIDTSTEESTPTSTPTVPESTPTSTSTSTGTPVVARLPRTGAGGPDSGTGGAASITLMVVAGIPVLAGAMLMLRTRERGRA